MLERLLPRQIDNGYRGHRLALWLFGALVLMKSAIALGVIFNGREAARSADGIPLDAFSPAGQEAFVALFAAWGLAQLMLCLVGVVALARYRAMVPLLFALFLLEHAARRALFWFLPLPHAAGSIGAYVNLALAALMLLGLALSLRIRAPRP